MAHNPSDAMARLLGVALGGLAALAGIALAGAGALILLGTREPGVWRFWGLVGFALAALGALLFLAAGGVTVWLVIDWRRRRADRSARP